MLLSAIAVASVLAVAGRADDPRFDQIASSIGPSPVDGGQDVLYKAQWHYIDNQTLTHPVVLITIPAGWTLAAADPDVCTQSGTTVTCLRDTIRNGDLIKQAVQLTTDADLGLQTVSSSLSFYERPPNPNGRRDTVPVPDAFVQVVAAGDPNVTGKCADSGGETVSTDAGVGGSTTSAVVPASTELCTPISIEEDPRLNPTEACFTGLECETDIVTTNALVFSVNNPIQLTLIFFGRSLNRNIPLVFNGGTAKELLVPECTGEPGEAIPDPCIESSSGGGRSVTHVVNWSGDDPTWTE